MRKFNITVEGKTYSVEVEEIGGGSSVAVPVAQAPVAQAQSVAPVATPAPAKKVAGKGAPVLAPMPGTILGFKVADGATVKKGQPVVILEAMKMENEINATADGVVTLVATKGATINSGDLLFTIA